LIRFTPITPHLELVGVVTNGHGTEFMLWDRLHGHGYTIRPRKAEDGFYVERFKEISGVKESLGPSTRDIKMYDDDDEPREEYTWTIIKIVNDGLVLKGSKNPKKEPKAYHLLRAGRLLCEAEPLSQSDLSRLTLTEDQTKLYESHYEQ